MNRTLNYFITDVFAVKKYSGNQLLTFLPGITISDEEMLAIAREINFSETTYILSDQADEMGYPVRIFTPGEEIPFAGHPTLGTAYIIQSKIIQKPVEQLKLNLKIGSIAVTFPQDGDGIIWMEQAAATFGKTLYKESLAPVLRLDNQDFDSDFPVEEVSTGFPFIIVPLKSLESLKECVLNRDLYFSLVNDAWAKNILVFCPGGYTDEQQLGVRVFPLFYGIEEDAATGSGNGCLAAYLVKNRYFKNDNIDITVGQGYELGRPSQIYLKATETAGEIIAHVGGKVTPIAEGTWYLE
jgi:trans-2,3-dihydro-3-hydroxyanthranilate isomerase